MATTNEFLRSTLKLLFSILTFHQTIHAAYLTIDSINKHVVDSLTLDSRLNELAELINRISVQELRMRDLAEHHVEQEWTMRRFAEWTVAPQPTAIQGSLEQMHTLMVGHPNLDYIGKGSLMLQLAEYLQVRKEVTSILFWGRGWGINRQLAISSMTQR